MEVKFLRKEWIAVALSNAKKEIFGENFITVSELQQFSEFLQHEFNARNLNTVIAYGLPDNEDFVIRDGIIVVPENWNIYMLSKSFQSILLDENLLIEFFMDFENKKIKRLQNINANNEKISGNQLTLKK